MKSATKQLGPGSFISIDAPLDVIGSGAIDDRCWWRATGAGYVLDILPAYRNMVDAAEARAEMVMDRARAVTDRLGDDLGLPDGTRLVLDETPLLAFHHEAGQTFAVDPRENVHTRDRVEHVDGDPRNNDVDNLRIARCSCYRDDVRDPNCRVHGTAAKSSTVGRSTARERSTVGLYWEDERR